MTVSMLVISCDTPGHRIHDTAPCTEYNNTRALDWQY